MNVIENVLHKFHFSSTLYCAYCTNRSPWGIGLSTSRSLQFHAVRSGKCWVRVDDQQLELDQGDFIVLPHGHAHEVVDSKNTPAIPAGTLLANIPESDRWMVSLGENGKLSQLICAGFLYQGGFQDPLLCFLPKYLHLKANETASLEPLLVIAEREMRIPGRGTGAMLARVAEMLVVECVRIFLSTLEAGRGGWLGALQDEKLALVINVIHENPARHWTLRDLSSLANMSRTSLATRFRSIVGISVQVYITRVRLMLAVSLLENPNRPKIAKIAEIVGYSSESTFSRAFIRELGITPTSFQRSTEIEKPKFRFKKLDKAAAGLQDD